MTGDNQNGGSLPSTRIGYETSSEWLNTHYYEISNCLPNSDLGLREISNAHIISYFHH